LKLEALQEQQIADAKEPRRKVVELTEAERSEALALLGDPNLLQRIVADIEACGMVGEATNKLAGYLAATSRKLNEPLAIVIQSSSSAGKTSLMDAILDMMPDEDQLRFSGMTGQSLFYLDSGAIRHKILAISEDEGIRRATYALKLLQSEGELRQATTAQSNSGRMETTTYHVEGPVQIMLTTTAMDIDEELVNRCLVLTVDETKNQTDAIQAKQRDARTLTQFDSIEVAKSLRHLHQNTQRLIQPIKVINSYAPQLTFANDKTRLRRDQKKYLTLIDTIALLHQHQRQVQTRQGSQGETVEFINVEPSDIVVANRIIGEVLGRSLDELSPQTRRLLMLLHEHVGSEAKAGGVSRHAFRFTRRDVREAISWSDTQVHRHLTRLVDLEYVVTHRGKHGKRFVYELLYRGEGKDSSDAAQPFLMGLLDPAKLTTPSTIPHSCGQ
jgi:DNA-binding MarR family transcriptional regulator